MNVRGRSALILCVPGLLVALIAAPSVGAAPPCGSGSTALENGGFEDPGTAPGTYAIYDASLVPPWNTTDVANGIEIWGDGFNGVPAFEAANFAELNANSAGTLYQDVVSTPGATMTWTLHHRAREGTDVMAVLIGDAAVADVLSDTGWDYVSPDISDDTTAWGTATDDYVVPAGQVCTRFAFRAVSTGSGNQSVGNFLDDVGFTVTIPPQPTPTPTPAATPTPIGSIAPIVTVPPTDAVSGSPRPATASLALVMIALLGLGAAIGATSRVARRPR